MRAIEVRENALDEIAKHLHPHDMKKLRTWYYSMCMDSRTGLTSQRYFFVPKVEFEGGGFMPPRTLSYIELSNVFDFTLPEDGWFELTHKPGMEHVV